MKIEKQFMRSMFVLRSGGLRTTRQVMAILIISTNPGCNYELVSRGLMLGLANTRALLRDLKEKGYLEAERSKTSGHYHTFKITAHSKQILMRSMVELEAGVPS